ncbi:hypothetical protein STEG23_028540 [Scotinomys teguina]
MAWRQRSSFPITITDLDEVASPSDQSAAITAHSFCHLFTKYHLQMNFKATVVFHVSLVILFFGVHQKTSVKGH